MAGGSTNPPKARKRVEAETGKEESGAAPSLLRAKDGSAFARCEECNKDVPVVLISMHSCSLDAKIKMNLGAQVVGLPAEVKKKPERKKPTTTSEPKAKKAKKEKKGQDPNMPKRPPTAFFIFMDDFRKTFKEANPDSKGAKEVAKEGGVKWRSMTDEEKIHYQDKANELKNDYEKAMENYKAKNKDNEEGSEKEDVENEDDDNEKGVQDVSDDD
ncbi:HMG_box domain-containing protein [Cephalotus follicularis]|uniref:HMG_box domain-containing protein n=1 Tax=Cephalotus follicularis TaxID=3775 RepID=A0A1Q3B323_CEPFO|nr:HMG_box domain-containing protein [Cephalotus follicularis]